jgi:hypothetical protein
MNIQLESPEKVIYRLQNMQTCFFFVANDGFCDCEVKFDRAIAHLSGNVAHVCGAYFCRVGITGKSEELFSKREKVCFDDGFCDNKFNFDRALDFFGGNDAHGCVAYGWLVGISEKSEELTSKSEKVCVILSWLMDFAITNLILIVRTLAMAENNRTGMLHTSVELESVKKVKN